MKYYIYLFIIFAFFTCNIEESKSDDNSSSSNNDGSDTTKIVVSGVLKNGVTTQPLSIVAATNTKTGSTIAVRTQSGTSETSGKFSITLPKIGIRHSGTRSEEFTDDTYIFTVIGLDGKPLGAPTFGTDINGDAITGVKPDSGFNLGDVLIPSDISNGLITVGNNDVSSDEAIIAKTSGGALVGVDTFGEGLAIVTPNNNNIADKDQDGLVDIVDADDDGDGIVDEFDSQTNINADKIKISLGYFLIVNPALANDYYKDESTLKNAYVRDMRLDIWVQTQTAVNDVKLLESPGAAYIGTLLTGPQQTKVNWKTFNGLSVSPAGGNDRKVLTYLLDSTYLFETGDTFNFKVYNTDGSEEIYTRMINYVFKKPSLFIKTGNSGTMVNYNPDNEYWINNPPTKIGEGNGGPSLPIYYDASSDLVIEIQPPVDENDIYMTKNITFEVSLGYRKGDGQGAASQIWGNQINENATFGSPYVSANSSWWDFFGFKKQINDIESTTVLTSAYDTVSHTFKVTIPKELLVKQVTMDLGTVETVTSFSIGTRFLIGTDINSWNVSTMESSLLFRFLN